LLVCRLAVETAGAATRAVQEVARRMAGPHALRRLADDGARPTLLDDRLAVRADAQARATDGGHVVRRSREVGLGVTQVRRFVTGVAGREVQADARGRSLVGDRVELVDFVLADGLAEVAVRVRHEVDEL